jgi:hypothetical protein
MSSSVLHKIAMREEVVPVPFRHTPSDGCWPADDRWWWCEDHRPDIYAPLHGKYILALGVCRVSCESGVLSYCGHYLWFCSHVKHVFLLYERMTQFVCCRLQMTWFETPTAGGDARHTPQTGCSVGTVTGALEFDNSESSDGGTSSYVCQQGRKSWWWGRGRWCRSVLWVTVGAMFRRQVLVKTKLNFVSGRTIKRHHHWAPVAGTHALRNRLAHLMMMCFICSYRNKK